MLTGRYLHEYFININICQSSIADTVTGTERTPVEFIIDVNTSQGANNIVIIDFILYKHSTSGSMQMRPGT